MYVGTCSNTVFVYSLASITTHTHKHSEILLSWHSHHNTGQLLSSPTRPKDVGHRKADPICCRGIWGLILLWLFFLMDYR